MSERRSTSTRDEPSTVVAEPSVHEKYVALHEVHQADVQRLAALKTAAQERDLSLEEGMEEMVVAARVAAREPRLESARLDAEEAADVRSLVEIVPRWERLSEAKKRAWEVFVEQIGQLRAALAVVMDLHEQQTALWAELPRHARGTEFLDSFSLRVSAASRMQPGARAWHELLSGPTPLQSPDVADIQDVDPGTKPLNIMYIQRQQQEASAWRRQQRQVESRGNR